MTIDITWRVWDMLTAEQRLTLNFSAKRGDRFDIKSYRPSKSKCHAGKIVVLIEDPRTGRRSELYPSGVAIRDIPV